MTNQTENYAHLSDEELLERCQKCGLQTRLWRQKFLGLLPEVARRGLYLKRGFSSIIEFACTLGGVSKEQVISVIRLEKKLENTPALHELLIEGKISHNKLERVASIAESKNEEFLAQQARTLSRRALDALVKDIKYDTLCLSGQTSALKNKTLTDQASARSSPDTQAQLIIETSGDNIDSKNEQPSSETAAETETSSTAKKPLTSKIHDILTLDLNETTIAKLKNLKNKGFDLNDLLAELLDLREKNITAEKAKIAQQQNQKEQIRKQKGLRPSRHIPSKIKKILKKEFGAKCAKSGCNKPAQHIHHTRRHALDPSHDPNYLAPLCKLHHEIAHAIDLNVQKNKWEKR